MRSIAKITIFIILMILVGSAIIFILSKSSVPSKHKNLEVCDRSGLDNITASLTYRLELAQQVNFYSLRNESEIFAVNLSLPVLCEGMISDFPELIQLYIRNANLTKIDPGTFQRVDKLKDVTIKKTLLTTIQKGVFNPVKSLVGIYLEDNHISTIQQGAFSDMPKLIIISLSRNKITSLNGNIFNGSPKISFIDIGKNQISRIDQNAFNDLELDERVVRLSFFMNHNFIEYFDPRSLQNISFPIDLHLERNKIAEYTDIILNCKNCRMVDLRHNRITDVPDKLLKNIASREIEVYLQENNLPCNITDGLEDMDNIRKSRLRKNLFLCY